MSGAIAIILGRAGSKGVPGKNTAIVGGQPCAAWTIEAALRSETVDRVTLSTDDAALQELAINRGIDVVARLPELASDTARVDDAARHAIDALGVPDSAAVVILYANVPVRPEGLIDRCVRLLEDSGADSVQSYAPVGKHHPWWMCRIDESSHDIAPWEGDTLNHGVFRRQDLPPAFIPDGGCLVVRAASLRNPLPGPHGFFGANRKGLRTGGGEVIDIDSPIDRIVADAILRERQSTPTPEHATR